MRTLNKRQKNAIDKWIKDNPTHGQATAFDAYYDIDIVAVYVEVAE